MDDAKTALARIDEWRKRLESLAESRIAEVEMRDLVDKNADALNKESIDKLIAGHRDEHGTVHEGLNISGILGLLFISLRASNKLADEKRLSSAKAQDLIEAWKYLDEVLGLGDAVVAVPDDVQALADQRGEARKAKDFAKSDELRKAIEARGWKVKDTAKGQELTRA
jgi:cysteinyl-tRNA synthetase